MSSFAAARPARVRRRLARRDPILIACSIVVALAILATVIGPLLAPYDPDAAQLQFANVGPDGGHLLGFDGQGRDLLSRLLCGARTSIAGPTLVVLGAVAAGSVLAVVSAWRGGWLDGGISTALDVLFAFPGILLAILAAAIFGTGVVAPSVALAVAYTPYIARVLRGAALRERAREYIAACEVQGLSAVAICVRHLIPNLMPLIVAQGTLLFSYAIVDFAAISFLGLGVQPPTADWGVMVSSGQPGLLQGFPAESLSAGAAIVAVAVAVNLLGERLAQRRSG